MDKIIKFEFKKDSKGFSFAINDILVIIEDVDFKAGETLILTDKTF